MEAIKGVIETLHRVARGFRNFDNYRLRALLAAGGHTPGGTPLTMLNCEGPETSIHVLTDQVHRTEQGDSP